MDMSLVSRASLRPPTHRSAGGDLGNAPAPSWILLDVSAYIIKRDNSTTATCKFRDDKEIKVTIFPAHPPCVSYLGVYCTGMKNNDYGVEPRVIAAEGNLILLRVAFGSLYEIWHPSAHEYFIYRADGCGPDGGPPLLEHLPHPGRFFIRDQQIGLLSYNNGGYTLAALLDDSSASHRTDYHSTPNQFDVCILHSGDTEWTIKAVNLPSLEYEFCHRW